MTSENSNVRKTNLQKMPHSITNYFDTESVIFNANQIDLDLVTRLEEQLEPCDVISMTFLLDDCHNNLLMHDSSEDNNNKLKYLTDWASRAEIECRPRWKFEFLEALAICQLFSVIRDLNMHVGYVKAFFEPNKINVAKYINPTKKVLFKMCDAITSDTLCKLKKHINTNINLDGMHINDSDPCEIVLVKVFNNSCNFNIFTTIDLSSDGYHNPNYINKINKDVILCKTTSLLNYLCLDDNILIKDDKFHIKDPGNNVYYDIKDKQRVGVCCVINQEDFDVYEGYTALKKRGHSHLDAINIHNTMSSLNFKVLHERNLKSNETFEALYKVIMDVVEKNDSMFVLYILSHGGSDSVFGSDSVRVKVDDIIKLLDNAELLFGIPKLVIIQACRDTDQENYPIYIPIIPTTDKFKQKSHFLISWACAYSQKAYSYPGIGAIFINQLCRFINEYSGSLDLYTIFTKVTQSISNVCDLLKISQTPEFDSTLENKLYLQDPLM